MSNEIITLWYACKFGACASSWMFLQCAVKSVAVSDICLPVYSN